jgi:hypothetical protein
MKGGSVARLRGGFINRYRADKRDQGRRAGGLFIPGCFLCFWYRSVYMVGRIDSSVKFMYIAFHICCSR